MSRRKEEVLAEIHAQALQEFDRIQSALYAERLQCLDDRRFATIAGAQWEGNISESFTNRPKFEFNRLRLAIRRLVGEYRKNRITVDFVPQDGEDDTMSDVCDGLYRADEQRSCAIEAYDNAFQESVTGGFGAWRIRADYEDEYDDKNDYQRACIEPIFDADSTVFFDLDAKRQDKADSRHCFVLMPMTRSAFLEEYEQEDSSSSSWHHSVQRTEFDWYTPDVIFTAEYYRIEKKKETTIIYRGQTVPGVPPDEKELSTEDLQDQEYLDQLTSLGYREVRRETKKVKRVHKYILSGSQVLEDCGIIAGKNIPIIPVYAEREIVDGIERCWGIVRVCRDAQRITNVFMSWLADIASRFDIEKPILAPEQIQGFEGMWSNDNISRFPYLLANPLRNMDGSIAAMGPVAYTKAPQIPPAIAGMLQAVENSLQELLGRADANDQIQSNVSGRAVEIITQVADAKTSIYSSNFERSMQRSGEIWLSMMRDIAVEESRKMKTLEPSGEAKSVELNKPSFNEETGENVYANDMTKATFDVVATAGPSSESKRSTAARAFINIAQMSTDPQTKMAMESLAVMNLEGEGLTDIRAWMRKRMVQQGILNPTDDEAKQMQEAAANQQPDPNTVYLQAAAQNEMAKAQGAQADMVLTAAKAEKTRADTANVLATMDQSAREHLIAVVKELQTATNPSNQVHIPATNTSDQTSTP